jgi:hypothetical protein
MALDPRDRSVPEGLGFAPAEPGFAATNRAIVVARPGD